MNSEYGTRVSERWSSLRLNHRLINFYANLWPLKILLTATVAIYAALVCGTVVAADNYQIEVLVFERLGSDTDEVWPHERAARYPRDGSVAGEVQPLPADANALEIVHFDDNSELATVAEAINRSANLQTILLLSWQQPRLSRTRAPRVPLRSQGSLDTRPLEGWLKISAGQIIQVEIALTLYANSGFAVENSTPDSTTQAIAGVTGDMVKHFTLTEKRRVKFGELNYFDHPELGAIVLITPVRG